MVSSPEPLEDGTKHIAVIICSSGTTGLSKGVCLSHVMLLDRATSYMRLITDDVTWCYSCISYISGLVALISGTLLGATRVISTDSFAAERVLRLIEKYKVERQQYYLIFIASTKH